MKRILTAMITLDGMAVSVAAQEFVDVIPPEPYPADNRWVWLLCALAAVILGTGIAVYTRARKKRNVQKLTPAEQAFRQLNTLQDSNMIKEGEFKEFYFKLSEVLRKYIEGNFAINAVDMTTEEFLDHLKDSRELTVEHKETLARFMKTSDMIKFAKQNPDAQRVLDDFQLVSGFIKQTEKTDV